MKTIAALNFLWRTVVTVWLSGLVIQWRSHVIGIKDDGRNFYIISVNINKHAMNVGNVKSVLHVGNLEPITGTMFPNLVAPIDLR